MYLDIAVLFYKLDEFCLWFLPLWYKRQLSSGERQRIKPSQLYPREVMTIVVAFHYSGYRTFKDFYTKHVQVYWRSEFPHLVSYNRFVELMQEALVPLAVYLMTQGKGKVTGIAFVDSTPLRVCHNRRASRHKVFEGLAGWGKNSMGWFYGFKLHVLVNDQGELLSVVLTPGNVDDRNREVIDILTKELWGKLFGDKGYICKELFEQLMDEGIQIITTIKKNMKNKLMPIVDKLLLRKRSIIETIHDTLKNVCQIEHSRHRSPINFVVNLLAGLVAYTQLPSKPALKLWDDDEYLPVLIA